MNMFCGIEIGGTKQQIALGSSQGILVRRTVKLGKNTSGPAIRDWIAQTLGDLQKEHEIVRIGIGFGGPLDSVHNRIHRSCQIEGWEGFPLQAWAQEQFQVPVFVRNDTAAGGLAEYYLGNGRGAHRLFYTNIGTGIGGGIFTELAYQESSFGYVYVPDWRQVQAGRPVILEKICSGKDTEERLNQPGYIPASSCLSALDHVTFRDLSAAVQQNDVFAVQELDRLTESYGIALAGYLAASYCDRVVIGGGVANMGEPLFSRIRKYTDQYAFSANRGRYEILPSRFLDDAVLMGAIYLAENEELQKLPWY